MSYQNYVFAAYAVFAIVRAWDFVAPRLAIRRFLRAAKARAARARNAAPVDKNAPLARE